MPGMTSEAVRLPLMVGVIIGGDGDWTLAATCEVSRYREILVDEADRVGAGGHPGVQVVVTIPGNHYSPVAPDGIRRYDAETDCVVYSAVVPQDLPCEEVGAFVVARLADAVAKAETLAKRRRLAFDFGPARAILERLPQL